VESVEVSVDGGETWAPAELAPDGGHRWAWRRFTYAWDAVPGRYLLTARATDAQGGMRPVDQAWNRGGFVNNAVQLVPVTCLD
jgi:hypothetical protein